jgi:uncharacterized protein (DUF1015 family)
VSTLRPFPARLVRARWAEHVVSPMHDALSREERAAIMAERPYSWLHVARTPDDAEDDRDVDARALDEANAAALHRLLDAGLFEDDAEPAIYMYRLRTADHEQTGIVGDVPTEAFVDGRVLGHEGVQPERVDALELHLQRLGARSTLVALAFRADDEIRKLIDEAIEEPPIRSFRTGDLEQTVWRLDDPDAVARIVEHLDQETLYITDGHHRAAASVDLWQRSGRPAGAGVTSVLFPHDELRMLAFHRRIAGPLPIGAEELLARLRQRFEVEEGPPGPGGRGVLGLYVDGRWFRVRIGGADAGGVDALDVARLHHEILEPIFGLGDVGDPRLEAVSDAVAVEELTRRVDEDGGAAFTLMPPTFEQFFSVADRGEQMPAKATYFDPKPQSGLFVRIAEDEA